ncbi:hypothetical protein F5884DRAFT_778817 [Xylogone sp. PMI_703]|nr:hypothetical protein F5884DRAFT_778817 [Xylogone sp. PMI_703]
MHFHHLNNAWRPVFWNRPMLSFFTIYLLAIVYCKFSYYKDPTSFFFRDGIGYRTSYTSIRLQQADAFIEWATFTKFRRTINNVSPQLCLGIRTITRKGTHYFQETVGSIFDGLTDSEHQEILFISLIAQTKPELHPAYQESWLYNVADVILRYNLSEKDMSRIQKLEEDRGVFREKALFDHTYLFKTCAQTGARYILMMEDDVIVVDGWYPKAKEDIQIAERKTYEKGRSECQF